MRNPKKAWLKHLKERLVLGEISEQDYQEQINNPPDYFPMPKVERGGKDKLLYNKHRMRDIRDYLRSIGVIKKKYNNRLTRRRLNYMKRLEANRQAKAHAELEAKKIAQRNKIAALEELERLKALEAMRKNRGRKC